MSPSHTLRCCGRRVAGLAPQSCRHMGCSDVMVGALLVDKMTGREDGTGAKLKGALFILDQIGTVVGIAQSSPP